MAFGPVTATALMSLPSYPFHLHLCQKQFTFFFAVFRNRRFRTFFRGRVTVAEETDSVCQADDPLREAVSEGSRSLQHHREPWKGAAARAVPGSCEQPAQMRGTGVEGLGTASTHCHGSI